MNPIMALIGQVFEPAAKLIDEMHTSEEEKLDAKTRMLGVQTALAMKVLDYEAQIMQMQSSVVLAEAQGQSWLQRNWRPITMLTFLLLVLLDSFGQLPFRLAAEAWTLLQIGLGGYVVGRSGEQIMKSMKTK